MPTFKDEETALEFIQTLPWGTAAGTCKNSGTAMAYASAGAKIVQFGSITWKARVGNAGDNFYYDHATGNSINALGIPNRGFDAYLPELIHLKPRVNALGGQLWVSISAGDTFDPYEYYEMSRMLYGNGAADVVAGNKSCPNIEVDGKRKPIVCYDLEAFKQGLAAMRDGAGGRPFAVKIAPITEARQLDDIVQACLDFGVTYIEGANTVPNCYMEKTAGVPAITMRRGGGAGRMLSPIINGMTTMIAPRLKGTNTKFLAVGGVLSGYDAYERLYLGAHGFEFNTALSARGGEPEVITEMIFGGEKHGLIDILVARGLPD